MTNYNLLDELYYRVKAKAGLCTPNLKQLADELEKAEEYARKAKDTASFVKVAAELPDELDKAANSIAGIHSGLSKLSSMAGDISAACQISEAVSELNKWAADPRGDNASAAAAFDKLFGAAARFASKLPPGVNQYAKILEQISVSRFFTNMQRLGASRAGENASTPTGRQMQEVMRELDRQSGR